MNPEIETSKKMFEEMRNQIENAGGLFYQYRPCRKNADLIYDIENIKNDIVFAQTPLNMNDPFDSKVGFSVKAFYEDCIEKMVEALEIDDFAKWILKFLLKHKVLGDFANAIKYIKQVRQYIIRQRIVLHKTNLNLDSFIKTNATELFKNRPKELKQKFDRNGFIFICLFASKFANDDINEAALNNILKLDDGLQKFIDQINFIRSANYEPVLKDFISKITVSCFSNSGWDNPLMWAHYANAYSGICVEYDFNKIGNTFKGLIYPVEYSDVRPTILLKDMGIEGFILKKNDPHHHIKKCEIETERLLKLLLVKNTCWQYEKEWRIINIGEAEKPLLINFPYIKSITIGMNIDATSKRIILDTCKIKNIPCYALEISTDNFSLTRTKLDINTFDEEYDRAAYIEYLSNSIIQNYQSFSEQCEVLQKSIEQKRIDTSSIHFLLKSIIHMLVDIYYLKNNHHYYFVEEMNRTGEPPIIAKETEESIMQINDAVNQLYQLSTEFDLTFLEKIGLIKTYELKKLSIDAKQVQDILKMIESSKWGI